MYSWSRHWLEVNDQFHAPGERAPQYPLDRRLGATEPVWTIWRSENLLPYRDSNSDSSVVQLVASRCTDWAVQVHIREDKGEITEVLRSIPGGCYFGRYTDGYMSCSAQSLQYWLCDAVHIGCSNPVVFDLSCSRTSRCNFSSTLYPQSCWCIIQVIHSP
jgi:hypothetical protein